MVLGSLCCRMTAFHDKRDEYELVTTTKNTTPILVDRCHWSNHAQLPTSFICTLSRIGLRNRNDSLAIQLITLLAFLLLVSLQCTYFVILSWRHSCWASDLPSALILICWCGVCGPIFNVQSHGAFCRATSTPVVSSFGADCHVPDAGWLAFSSDVWISATACWPIFLFTWPADWLQSVPNAAVRLMYRP